MSQAQKPGVGIPGKTRERLMQLMGMTGSDFDGEALAALRAAQKIAAGQGLTLTEALVASAVSEAVTAAKAAATALDLQRVQILEAEAFKRGFTAARKEAKVGTWSSGSFGTNAANPYGQAGQNTAATVSMCPIADWCEMILQNYGHMIDGWQTGFCQTYVKSRWHRPTDKQIVSLHRLADRCRIAVPGFVPPIPAGVP